MAKIIKIPSAYVMDTKIVGVTKDNADGASRQELIRKEVEENDLLELELEPTNDFDTNAIKVLSRNRNQIGYLSKDTAERIHSAILNEVDITVRVSWVSGEKFVGVGLRIELVN